MEILKSLVERRERKRGREGRQVWRESGGARGIGEDRDLGIRNGEERRERVLERLGEVVIPL